MASRPPPLDYAPSIQNHTVRRTTPVADPCSLLHSTPSPTNNHHCQQDTMSCDGDDDGTNYGGKLTRCSADTRHLQYGVGRRERRLDLHVLRDGGG